MRTALAALAVTLACARAASAQAKPDVAALEASGNKHFELAEYDAAITDFKEAFRISDEPGFLYNIAQAYRLKRDCREAATFYKTYLRRVPSAPNATKIRERIAEMDKCAETQPVVPAPTTVTAPAEPATPVPVAPTPDVPPPQAGDGRAWMKWSGIAAIGVGAIGIGLGMKFVLDGRSANDDLAEQCATSCTSEEALALEADGAAANRNAVIAMVAGGAVLATGVVFLVLARGGSAPADRESAAALRLTPGGAVASYGWQF